MPQTSSSPKQHPATCPLNQEGILACLRSLGDRPTANDVLTLATRVKAQQIEHAYRDIGNYTIWRSPWGETMGLKKDSGKGYSIFRRMYVHGRCNSWGEPTHWQVDGAEHMRAINAIHRALNDIEFRYPQRRDQVKEARPQPKHYWILRWLRSETPRSTQQRGL